MSETPITISRPDHDILLKPVPWLEESKIPGHLAEGRPYEGTPVVSAHIGQNSGLIADAARLYIPDDAMVLDCTYGKGAFWKDTDTSRFSLTGSDIANLSGTEHENRTLHSGIDFTKLPTWWKHVFEVVVFDPPYKSGGSTSHESMVDTYGLQHLDTDTKSKHGNVGNLMKLYAAGMTSISKVLRPDGALVWVKCQDMIESGKQHWLHIDIYNFGRTLGWQPLDLFHLVNSRSPMMRHTTQRHARKNNSYLWVFYVAPKKSYQPSFG